MPAAPFAYVFERFPSFTQTFCAREVLELQRLGMRPLVFSIHDTREEAIRHFPRALVEQVVFLPHGEALVNEVKQLKDANRLSKEAVLTLRHWGNRPDKRRVQEACWIGVRLQEAGVHHAHAHFGGLAARTCWWLRQFFGITFSFTGHANDILCPDIFEVSRERLMADASAASPATGTRSSTYWRCQPAAPAPACSLKSAWIWAAQAPRRGRSASATPRMRSSG